MQTKVIFYVFLVLGSFLVYALIKNSRITRKENKLLKKVGFLPCPKDIAYLNNLLNDLMLHPSLSKFFARRTMRCDMAGKTVYFYTKNSESAGERDIELFNGQFIFPFSGSRMEHGFLFLRTARTPMFLDRMTALGESMAIGKGVRKIEIPKSVSKDAVVAAFAPEGSSFYDFAGERDLENIMQSHEWGVSSFIVGNGFAEIGYFSNMRVWDLEKIWGLVKELLQEA